MFPSSQTTGFRVQKLSPKRIHINYPWNTSDTMFHLSLYHTILRRRQYLQKKIILHINFKRILWYLFQAIHYLKWSDHFRMFYSAGKVSAGSTWIFLHRELQTCSFWLSCSFQPWHTVPKMKHVCLVSFDYFFFKDAERGCRV